MSAKRSQQDRAEFEKEHDENVQQNEQPLLSHLIELRKRLLRSLIVVATACIPYLVFSQEVFGFIANVITPYSKQSLLASKVMEPFIQQLVLGLVLAIYTTMPYLLSQLWGFISPGLYLKEKKFAVPLLITSIVLFYTGVAFSIFVVFPLVFQFLAAILPTDVMWMPTMTDSLSFFIKVPLAFGIVFEIPIAIVLLVATGITSVKTLSKARPYIFISCFVLGMLLTPPDVISQVLLAIPAWILYEFGLLFARIVKKKPKKEDEE